MDVRVKTCAAEVERRFGFLAVGYGFNCPEITGTGEEYVATLITRDDHPDRRRDEISHRTRPPEAARCRPAAGHDGRGAAGLAGEGEYLPPEPKVFFQVGAACSFSEGAMTTVASRSMTTGPPPAPGVDGDVGQASPAER